MTEGQPRYIEGGIDTAGYVYSTQRTELLRIVAGAITESGIATIEVFPHEQQVDRQGNALVTEGENAQERVCIRNLSAAPDEPGRLDKFWRVLVEVILRDNTLREASVPDDVRQAKLHEGIMANLAFERSLPR